MMRTFLIGGSLAAAMLALAVLVAGSAQGKISEGETRPLKTKTLMGKVVGPNCSGIAEGLKAEKIDWAALHGNAELLNECSYIIMDDKRCPDETWAGASKTLRECSDVLLKKLEAEDAEGAKTAFKALTESCGACHKAHKPKK